MVDVTATTQTIEERKDLGGDDAALWAYWSTQEKIVEKEERRWVKQGRQIVKRYRDERPEAAAHIHRYNILWSNVQTLMPTLYAKTPAADVRRRFLDQDDVGRLASTILERAISYSTDVYDFDGVIKAAVQDRLLPGRGVARILYVPHFGEPIREDENAQFETEGDAPSVIDGPGDQTPVTQPAPVDENPVQEQLREVLYEEAITKYVFWEDYREGAARSWPEVPWIRYKSYMTRDELVARFKAKGRKVNLDFTPRGGTETTKDDPPADIYKKAVVHEIWDKTKRQVVWLAPGTPDLILDKVDDPLGLTDFFPSPDPLLATTTNDKRIPVADFVEYQDQAREMDSLTARIDVLQRALKVSGVYAGAEKQVLQQLVDEGTENRLIPVEDWQAFTDKGGVQNLIQWMPIQQIAETLIQLYSARDKVKADLYEITGIGDIMRGNTDPNETLGAQQLKANFSTRRIVPQQRDVAKFARDLIRIMAAVIAEHFSPKTLSMITGYPQLKPVPPVPPQPQAPMMMAPPMPGQPGQPPAPPNPQMQAYQQAMAQWQQAVQAAQAVTAENMQLQQQFDQAVALLRKDALHDFRIDIETDSTIAPDEQAEKQARVEFLQQMVPLLEQVVPLAQGNPPLASLAKEIVLFAARGFRVARPLEETLEKAFDAIAQMPPNPKTTGQGQQKQGGVDSPGDLAVRSKEIDAKTQVAQQANAIKAQQVAQQAQADQAKLAAEQMRTHAELAMDAARLQDEHNFRAARTLAIESREATGLK